jgi:hypothetical protein
MHKASESQDERRALLLDYRHCVGLRLNFVAAKKHKSTKGSGPVCAFCGSKLDSSLGEGLFPEEARKALED